MDKYYTCPRCGKSGRWRRGIHFEHEKICFCEDGVNIIWDPSEEVQWEIMYKDLHKGEI